jgi:hypothetical protein
VAERVVFAKSSVFSLMSITVLIRVSKMREKKNVVKKFLRIYQSTFFIAMAQKYH